MTEDVFSLRGVVALEWLGKRQVKVGAAFMAVLAVASKFPNGSCGSAPTVNMTNLCE